MVYYAGMTLSPIFNIIALVIAVTIHEFSHAWTATRLGDPTAHVHGRVTLNPLKHLDLLGTLALIFFHFGWGKPVPFNPHNLRKPTRDSALIACAGPASNIITAILCAIPLKYLAMTTFAATLPYAFIGHLFGVSIFIFALNVLPFPPFDGSKIIGIFIPHRYKYQYDRFLENGVTWVLIFIAFDQMIIKYLTGESVLGTIIGGMASWIFALVGLGS